MPVSLPCQPCKHLSDTRACCPAQHHPPLPILPSRTARARSAPGWPSWRRSWRSRAACCARCWLPRGRALPRPMSRPEVPRCRAAPCCYGALASPASSVGWLLGLAAGALHSRRPPSHRREVRCAPCPAARCNSAGCKPAPLRACAVPHLPSPKERVPPAHIFVWVRPLPCFPLPAFSSHPPALPC